MRCKIITIFLSVFFVVFLNTLGYNCLMIQFSIGKFKGKAIALISEEDLELVSKYKWTRSAAPHGKYYVTSISKPSFSMHRLIMGFPEKPFQVDHINHDGLDNRRENLRVVTRQQNQYNRKPAYNGTSKYLGVRKTGKWFIAQIGLGNEKTRILGRFENEIDAALAYNKAAKELRGEYASLNNIHNGRI